ncbi:MAG: 4Fe-4S dicluster domain-containing protein [Anaerolineae bacterium]|nr:4Fe-4S dicluster domain-containing protein [Anaerolineae bacterium]
MRPRRLRLDDGTCIGCMSCVVVCAERHNLRSSLSRSRIRVEVDTLSARHMSRYCRQCVHAPCATACPVQAIEFDEQLGVWMVDAGRCTGCGACVEACPFGAVWLDPVDGVALKCDLCLGRAWCVEVCPPRALSVVGRDEEAEND